MCANVCAEWTMSTYYVGIDVYVVCDIYLYAYVHVYIDLCVYKKVYIYIYIYMYTYVYIYMLFCVYIHVDTGIDVLGYCPYAYEHTLIFARVYVGQIICRQLCMRVCT